jgi:hypothetical protein
VDFGRDQKAQLATVVLFRIINGTEKAVRNGWTPVSSNGNIYKVFCITKGYVYRLFESSSTSSLTR